MSNGAHTKRAKFCSGTTFAHTGPSIDPSRQVPRTASRAITAYNGGFSARLLSSSSAPPRKALEAVDVGEILATGPTAISGAAALDRSRTFVPPSKAAPRAWRRLRQARAPVLTGDPYDHDGRAREGHETPFAPPLLVVPTPITGSKSDPWVTLRHPKSEKTGMTGAGLGRTETHPGGKNWGPP